MEMQGFNAPTAADEFIPTTGFSSEWFWMTLDAKTDARVRPTSFKANAYLFSGASTQQIRPFRLLKAGYDI